MRRSSRLAALALWAALALAWPARGQEAAAPDILLAGVCRDEIDVARYWVSEKLDGVRAIWDGNTLRFRSGNPVPAPAWFIAGLPAQPLDGELWLGRGGFERLAGIVRKQVPVDHEWRQVRYMVFELPGAPGSFTDRIARMEAIVAGAGVPWLDRVAQYRVPDRAELMRRLDAVVRGGGEGLMLHRADAHYVTGRGEVLLKLKPWLDAEARVLAHLPGKGRLRGLMGALLLETPDGRRFRLGTGFNLAQRRQPPAIGSSVTYRYRELTRSGLPRFPSYLRVRDTF